jgi:tetratricopeptide (TPR) repeat protein
MTGILLTHSEFLPGNTPRRHMTRFSTAMLALTSALLVGACGAGTPQKDEVREAASLAIWEHQTSSEEARQQIADGVRELDLNRPVEAYAHFERAIAADPNSVMANLGAMWAAQSQEAYLRHLTRAEQLSANGSEVLRTLVQVYRKQQDQDDTGALMAAKRLTELAPTNPRSWDVLAQMHTTRSEHSEARAAWEKAIEIAPDLATHYFWLIQSYATVEPTDFVKAEQLGRKGVELEPNEPFAHDMLGDALRAQGKLDEAGAAYTKAAELDPTNGGALQQRGHVNTFLGRYAEARADYDAAIALATRNQKATLAMYRPLVSVHEGNPQAGIDELEQLTNSIDAMKVDEPVGMKINVTQPQLNLATYYRLVDVAERLVNRLDALNAEAVAQAKSPEVERRERANRALRHAQLAFAKRDFATVRARLDEYTTIRANDQSPTKMRPVHNWLGQIALEEKRYADAVRELEQGSLDDIFYVHQLGLALEGAGRTAEAQKQFNKVANYYFSNEGTAMVRKDALAKVKATS